MSLEQFQDLVATVDQLEALIGTPGELVVKKQLDRLDHHMTSFIHQSPLVLMGTFNEEGRCDVSPRGDLPAVARVLDSQTLVFAERRGNRRADSLRNILQTGRVGLLFLVPGLGETLRVNGRACVFLDEELLASMTVNGKQPQAGVGVQVQECYFQCAKALIRSKLWDFPTTGGEPKSLDFAKILVDQTKLEDENVESLREMIEDSYRNNLY